tara:strand:+ start:2937 stop:3257 length:321 start_codon:yes stop_codon:yes gene_type:complete
LAADFADLLGVRALRVQAVVHTNTTARGQQGSTERERNTGLDGLGLADLGLLGRLRLDEVHLLEGFGGVEAVLVGEELNRIANTSHNRAVECALRRVVKVEVNGHS